MAALSGAPRINPPDPRARSGVLDIVNDREAMEMLFKVVPRVVREVAVGHGSSTTRRKEEENGLIVDKEPLFPTIDDVIMRSTGPRDEFPDSKGRPIPDDELSEHPERSSSSLRRTAGAIRN